MLCAYDMGGILHTFTLTVFVGMVLLSSMHSAAREVDFHRSDNEIRNITADLLNEVCHSVGIEPSLQPVTGGAV